MENFNDNRLSLDVISNFHHDQLSNLNETEYANSVTETFQSRSVLSSSSDTMDAIGRYMAVMGVILLSLFTLGGNLVIILSVIKSTNLSGTNYSVYIVSLAFADFCVGLLVMPLMVIYTYYGYWPLGNVPCTLFIILDYGVCTTSQLHLSAIAYDRLQSVSQPLKYRSTFTRGRAAKVCVCLWIGTFFFWTPGVLVTRVLKAVDGTMVLDQCYYLPNKYYALSSVILFCLLTDASMITLSIMLVRALRTRQIPELEAKSTESCQISSGKLTAIKQKQMVDKNTKDGNYGEDILNVKTSNSQIETVSSKETNKVTDQNHRVIRTLVILITVYVICLTPWKVCYPIYPFCNSCVPEAAYNFANWMSYANSFVNPYVYLAFNSDFRVAFHQVFCHC